MPAVVVQELSHARVDGVVEGDAHEVSLSVGAHLADLCLLRIFTQKGDLGQIVTLRDDANDLTVIAVTLCNCKSTNLVSNHYLDSLCRVCVFGDLPVDSKVARLLKGGAGCLVERVSRGVQHRPELKAVVEASEAAGLLGHVGAGNREGRASSDSHHF